MEAFTHEMLPEVVARLCEKVQALERNQAEGKREPLLPSRCASGLGKNELAQLFYILMDEGLFFFDRHDPQKNRSMLQLFLQRNFTYCGDGSVQTPITAVSKEFSEAKGYTYKDKQLRFLDKMIRCLQERRQRLAEK